MVLVALPILVGPPAALPLVGEVASAAGTNADLESAGPEAAQEEAGSVDSQSQPLRGRVYLNDRYGYALRRPADWNFRFEPGMDVIIAPNGNRAEIQVVARTFFDIRFQNIPEGLLTRSLRTAARSSGQPFRQLHRSLSPALREYLQLFWLDAYVAWHTEATAEEYQEFHLESRRELRVGGHGGVELVYTLQGKRRPGLQKIKTIIVAYDERVCQLSYIASKRDYQDDLEEFHAVVNSLYLHRDRS